MPSVPSASATTDHPASAAYAICVRGFGAVCAFGEPQIAPALLDTVIEDTSIKRDVLDPVEAALPPGPDAYFAMTTGNTDALERCLSSAK